MFFSDLIKLFTNDWQALVALISFFIIIASCLWYEFGTKYQEKFSRGFILLIVVFIEITILCLAWDEIERFIHKNNRIEWLKGLLPLIMGALPAYLLWHWRDKDKKETIEQGRDDLKQKERDLKLKEDNDAWENFRKYQEIVEWEKNEYGQTITDAQKTSAIYALENYYKRQATNFPEQVHEFFKEVLDNYWNNDIEFQQYCKFKKIVELLKKYLKRPLSEDGRDEEDIFVEIKRNLEILKKISNPKFCNLKDLGLEKINSNYKFKLQPEEIEEHMDLLTNQLIALRKQAKEKKIKRYIQAIYDVLKRISHETSQNDIKMFDKQNLSLSGFRFINTNIEGMNLEFANLSDAYFMNVSLFDNFNNQTFENVDFSQATFTDMEFSNKTFSLTNFREAKMERVKLFECKFNQTDIVRINIEESFITNSNFSENYNNGGPVYINNSTIQDSTFEKNNMDRSRFINTKYLNLKFDESKLKESYFNIFPKLTNSSHLTNMLLSFIDTDLAGSNFANSRLEKVDFQKSILWAASFEKTEIATCEFKDAHYAHRKANTDKIFAEKKFISKSSAIFSDFLIDFEKLYEDRLGGKYKNIAIYDKAYLCCPQNTSFPSKFSVPSNKMIEFYEYILSIAKEQ